MPATNDDFTPRFFGVPADQYLQISHDRPGTRGPIRDTRSGRSRQPVSYRKQFVRRKV